MLLCAYIKGTSQKKETVGRGVTLENRAETFFLNIFCVRKRHKVPTTFLQRLLQNWQNPCDISQLPLILWIRLTSKLSTFLAVKHPSPAARLRRAPGENPGPPASLPVHLHPGGTEVPVALCTLPSQTWPPGPHNKEVGLSVGILPTSFSSWVSEPELRFSVFLI